MIFLFLLLLFSGSLPRGATPATPSTPEEDLAREESDYPGQQISGFIRYIPDDDGDIDWELKGSRAHFLSPELVKIKDLVAISHDQDIGDLRIQVDRVLYNTRTEVANAKGEWVNIRRGNNMVLTGKGIVWLPAEKQIRVLENVRVLIKEKDNLGLFPL